MDKDKPSYHTLLEEMLKAFVNYPEEIEVKRTLDEMGVLLTVKANPQDMGLIIGRRGAMARALRTIIRMIGLKYHARVNIKIEEPAQSQRGGQHGGREPVHAPQAQSAPSFDDVIEELKK